MASRSSSIIRGDASRTQPQRSFSPTVSSIASPRSQRRHASSTWPASPSRLLDSSRSRAMPGDGELRPGRRRSPRSRGGAAAGHRPGFGPKAGQRGHDSAAGSSPSIRAFRVSSSGARLVSHARLPRLGQREAVEVPLGQAGGGGGRGPRRRQVEGGVARPSPASGSGWRWPPVRRSPATCRPATTPARASLDPAGAHAHIGWRARRNPDGDSLGRGRGRRGRGGGPLSARGRLRGRRAGRRRCFFVVGAQPERQRARRSRRLTSSTATIQGGGQARGGGRGPTSREDRSGFSVSSSSCGS